MMSTFAVVLVISGVVSGAAMIAIALPFRLTRNGSGAIVISRKFEPSLLYASWLTDPFVVGPMSHFWKRVCIGTDAVCVQSVSAASALGRSVPVEAEAVALPLASV